MISHMAFTAQMTGSKKNLAAEFSMRDFLLFGLIPVT